MLEIKNLSFSYGERPVLRDVIMKAEKGELVSILGSNGAGKSTLFRCVLGILGNYSGSIFVNGRDTRGMTVRELAGEIAYIPQMSVSAFNYSAEDIVLMGTTAGLGSLRSPGAKEKKRAEEAMEHMGITELRHRCFHRLSGGERQLVIIARALAQQANILLLDEPASALDFGNQLRILSRARALAREGYTVLQTTHDPEKAYMFSDRMIALKNGRIFAQGSPAEVLTAENIRALYGIDTELTSLFDDKARAVTPRGL